MPSIEELTSESLVREARSLVIGKALAVVYLDTVPGFDIKPVVNELRVALGEYDKAIQSLINPGTSINAGDTSCPEA